MQRLRALFVGIAVAAVAGAWAVSGGGLPSFPQFQSVGIGTAPPGAGQLGTSGNVTVGGALNVTNGVTGSSFTPSSSSVPPNGIYLPSANALGFATNTTSRGSISSAGAWTINAPTSGAHAVNIVNSGNGWTWFDGTSTLAIQTDVSHNFFFGSTNGALLGLITNNTTRVSVDASGAFIKGYGPTAAGLVDMTPDKGTFTLQYGGMTAVVSCTATWTRVGNIVVLLLCAATGTSNSTAMNGTTLPAAIIPATLSQRVPIAASAPEDNNVNASNIIADVTITAGSSTLNFNKSGAATGWTSSGVKGMFNPATITYTLQ